MPARWDRVNALVTLFNQTLFRAVNRPQFLALPELRSASDSGYYPEIARRAATNTRAFAEFRRNPMYREILEHVSQEQGAEYLEQARRKWPKVIGEPEKFTINDRIGNPARFRYPDVGSVNPTTLRYLKVACDLRELFGSLSGFHVAEVGVGYGGQFLVADQLWPLGSWTLFDLDPVLQLTSRYLECHLLNSAYRTMTLNRFVSDGHPFDLVISNYAFSELPKRLQLTYMSKVIGKCKRGYMTMNTGKTAGDGSVLIVDDLREYLPGLEIHDEVPLTGPGNYILVWGRQPPT